MNVLMCGSVLSVKGGMVTVVSNYLGYKDWDGINVYFIPTQINRNKLYLVCFFIWAYIKILFLITTKNIDIAHLHTAERGSFYRKAFLVKTLRFFGVKTIMHHHAAEFEQFYNDLTTSQKKYVKYILEKVDLNIVLGEVFYQSIKNKAPNSNVKILYNAVETYSHNPYNNNAVNVLFLGVFCKRKGIYDLLHVIKELDTQIDSNIKFYICGDGEAEKVNALINELSISNRIGYLGWIGKEQKQELFSNVMINVLPSYNEGLPMAVLETMAYGIPNISTNIASIPNVLFDNVNGFLVEPGDRIKLADSIKRLIEDKDLREQFSYNSYQLITDKFSLKNNIESLKQIYKSL